MNETPARSIPLEQVDPDALKVVRRLTRHGHEAYLVGGCVRDLLLQRTPKDFDVSTSATPPEIRKLFRNCRIIGRRFRLAHIFFGRKIIETSTFRARPPAPHGESQIIRQDNIFGTAEEDALRRDFTINGLFHDVRANEVIDHVDGLEDLERHRVRTIGDPHVRIPEDPVRILRAIKFATRLGFELDPATRAAIEEHRGLLAQCSVARVLEEIYRLLASGHAAPALKMMSELGVTAVLLPELRGVARAADAAPHAGAGPEPFIHDRSGVPRRGRDEGPPPRDTALPERVAPDPTRDQAAELAAIDALVAELLGPDPADHARATEWTWLHLEALDALVARQGTAPTHTLCLAALCYGLLARQLTDELPVGEAIDHIERLVQALSTRLRISRKDRERLRQILSAQRRMVHRGRRTRPSTLLRRDYFEEGWQLFESSARATGRAEEHLARWEQLRRGAGGGKKRRRGRRRRRR